MVNYDGLKDRLQEKYDNVKYDLGLVADAGKSALKYMPEQLFGLATSYGGMELAKENPVLGIPLIIAGVGLIFDGQVRMYTEL